MSFTPQQSLRRARHLSPLTIVATTLLLGGALLVEAPPSSAVTPPMASYMTVAEADTGSGSCTATGGLATDNVTVPYALGHTVHQNLSNEATVVSNTDSTDTTTISSSARSTVSSSLVGGTLSTLHIAGVGSTTITAAKGAATVCDPKGSGESGILISFTLTRPGWITSTLSTSSTATTGAVIIEDATTSSGVVSASLTKGTSTSHGLVPAGSYSGEIVGGVGGGLLGSPTTFAGNGTRAGSYTLDVKFTPIGFATGAARGTASVATLPAAISCTAHTAKLTWKKDATKAGSAVVTVNGKHPKTVKNPKSGKHLVVKNLPAAAPVTLTVRAGSKSVSRSYEPCS